MFKLLKNKKIFRAIAFMLVAVFTINVTGCSEPNNVASGQDGGGNKNYSVGVGDNIDGYMVYSESTFDPMTLDLFMGYLLNGRNFTLVVVPGSCSENCDNGSNKEDLDERVYEFDNQENILFNQANNGVYKFNEYLGGGYENAQEKALMYYVTDSQLNDWFGYFNKDDNFMSNAMEFLDAETDVAKPSRFKCKDLVNFGEGLNATDFCDKIIKNIPVDTEKNAYSACIIGDYSSLFANGDCLFSDGKYGGMILLFGFNSIEGYITYNHINNYAGSKTANVLLMDSCDYTPGLVLKLDVQSIISGDFRMKSSDSVPNEDTKAKNQRDLFEKILTLYPTSYTIDDKVMNVGQLMNSWNQHSTAMLQDDYFKNHVISAYTDILINKYRQGVTGACDNLRLTYELIERSLITDYEDEIKAHGSLQAYGDSLYKSAWGSGVNVLMNRKELEQAQALYDIIKMVTSSDYFDQQKREEAFNIKFSSALFSRYNETKSLSRTDVLLEKSLTKEVTTITDKDTMVDLVNGVAEKTGNIVNAESYVALITAEGFIIDRGSEEDQIAVGAADMLGMSGLLQELVKMDACPNKTLAAEVFNMLANLKIIAGAALAITGAVVAAGAIIGLTVASVIGKLALVGLATPVPGARIVALVLAVVAGLIALGVGLYTLFQGLKDKARIKGMGASETNYCETYVATFNVLFDNMEINIPVYHYNIGRSSRDAISLYYCEEGDYNSGDNESNSDDDTCVGDNGEVVGTPIGVPMYYYADLDIAEELDVDGMPVVMFFHKRELVDYIYGATTPEFIIDTLRIWGILAMREIVYKAATELVGPEDNQHVVVSVSHTSNDNSRTLGIKGVKYCYTLDTGLDLYDDTLFDGYDDPLCIYPNEEGMEFKQKDYGNYLKISEGVFESILDEKRYDRKKEEDGSYTYTQKNAGDYLKSGESYYLIEDSSRYNKVAINGNAQTAKKYQFDLSNPSAGMENGQFNPYYNYLSSDLKEIFRIDVTSDGSLEYVKNYFKSLYEGLSGSTLFYTLPSYRYRAVRDGDNGIEYQSLTITQDNIVSYDMERISAATKDEKAKWSAEIKYKDGNITKSIKGTGSLYYIGGTDYFVTEDDIYSIPKVEINESSGAITLNGEIKHVAKFKKSLTKLKEALEAENNVADPTNEIEAVKNMKIQFSDFLGYVVGYKVFEDEVEMESIYFTATIKDVPQKSCGDGEYEYSRDGWLFFDNDSKCLADEDYNSEKDTPNKSSKENKYSTSVKIGTVKIILKGDVKPDEPQMTVKVEFVGLKDDIDIDCED